MEYSKHLLYFSCVNLQATFDIYILKKQPQNTDFLGRQLCIGQCCALCLRCSSKASSQHRGTWIASTSRFSGFRTQNKTLITPTCLPDSSSITHADGYSSFFPQICLLASSLDQSLTLGFLLHKSLLLSFSKLWPISSQISPGLRYSNYLQY